MSFVFIILIGIFSLVIGFFVGRNSLSKIVSTLTESNEDLKYKLDMLNAKNKTLMANFKNKQNTNDNSQISINPLELNERINIKELVIVDSEDIKRLYGKVVDINDFKIIEGIGPKLEKLLNQSEINTWLDLANSSPATLKEFLKNYGNRYTLHDPTAWPKQAELAASGKWSELKIYQSKLHKGKETS